MLKYITMKEVCVNHNEKINKNYHHIDKHNKLHKDLFDLDKFYIGDLIKIYYQDNTYNIIKISNIEYLDKIIWFEIIE